MDSKWTRVIAPEDHSEVPPLPSRAEELAYLDKLEKEFRDQSYKDSSFHPDPTRRLQVDMYHKSVQFEAQKKRKMFAIAALISPFSFWLCNNTYVKHCPQGIPYRSYPMQHKVRFWTFFLAYEFAFTWFIYYSTLDQNTIEQGVWPVNRVSKRVL
jgi:hypothetical protein